LTNLQKSHFTEIEKESYVNTAGVITLENTFTSAEDRMYLRIINTTVFRGSFASKVFHGHSNVIKQSRFSTSLFRTESVDRESIVETDLVKAAVHELLQKRVSTKIIITDQQLQKHYKNFMHSLKEAKLCIYDCKELQIKNGQHLQEEIEQATQAVDIVFACYIDMLDAFRACPEKQTEKFGDLRKETVSEMNALRQQLDSIVIKAA